MASAINACLTRGIRPSFSSILAFVHTPTRVPIVSNISIKSIVNTTISISILNTLLQSNWQKIGSIESGQATKPFKSVNPIGTPMAVVTSKPISNAPRTFFTTRVPVISKPSKPSSGTGDIISPIVTNVALSLTIIPAFCNPIKAINRPIPTPIALRSDAGIAFTIASRRFDSVIRINITPSIKTAVSANCHG